MAALAGAWENQVPDLLAAPPPAWDQPLLNRQGSAASATLEGFQAAGGFRGLARARSLEPAEVIMQLRDAGLRGRGLGARPVYAKWWRFYQSGGGGLLVVDAREADPAGLASRRLLERDPYGLVEALAIAARATGLTTARVRLGPELGGLLPELREALEEARAAGLLQGVGGLSLAPYDEISPPGLRPPPELSHTLETWYQVGLALAMGPERYRGLGLAGQAGSRLITVVGASGVSRLVEVAEGAPLEAALEAAGVAGELAAAKGLSLAGGVGGFLAPGQAGAPLAPEELMSLGVSPAVSTLWVLNQNHCVVDLARRALTRVLNLGVEAEGSPRQLTLHAVRLITQVALRRAEEVMLEHLQELAAQLFKQGAAGAWALSSALRYFPQEWRLHLQGQSCAAYDCLMPLVARCQAGCPAGIDIPSFLALVGQERHAEAVEVIRQDNPLPYICGLVCPAPCEEVCLRGELDQAVSIRAMKAVAARHALAEGGYPRPETAAATGKRAAVVGAGPAGLTCAYFLALAGHQVTVFEAGPVAGGTAFFGIPAYRLPREVIRAEVEAICELGVVLRLNTALGRDFTLEGLRGEGYDAVFLGIGALQATRPNLPGEELAGVQSGVEFLRRASLDQAERPGRRVAVIGGGNVAMDAARTALRLGSEEVTVLYRRSAQEMPAFEHEVEEALEEGVELELLTMPTSFQGEDGRLAAVEVVRMRLGEADASGRRRPVPVEGSERRLEVDGVLTAIGQRPDASCLDADCGVEVARGSRLVADPVTMRCGPEWVFAGGDAVTGPATVVDAVAAGKRAAKAMDRYLAGQTVELAMMAPQARAQVEPVRFSPAERANPQRPLMARRSPARRRQDFAQVELGLTDPQAREAAARCLRCDLCIGCGLCQTACAEVGAEALSFRPAGDRLIIADFLRPANNCLGCGACANACPTGALKAVDEGRVRRLMMTGTPLREIELLPCSVCGRPYAPRVQLEQVSRRLEDRPHQRVEEQVCPACARLRQVREKWADRFLRMSSHGSTGGLSQPSLRHGG
jgi:NADH-quinone oxidoreductase subunit F